VDSGEGVKYGEFPSLLSYHGLLVTIARFPRIFPFEWYPYHNFLCSGSLTIVHSHLSLSSFGLLLTSPVYLRLRVQRQSFHRLPLDSRQVPCI
jgi:hypothetical protein